MSCFYLMVFCLIFGIVCVIPQYLLRGVGMTAVAIVGIIFLIIAVWMYSSLKKGERGLVAVYLLFAWGFWISMVSVNLV